MKNLRVLKWFLVFGLWYSAGCAGNSISLTAVNSPIQNNSAVNTTVNANVSPGNSYEAAVAATRENERIVKELETQNERFKVVPPEFEKTDFKNFTYPTQYPYKSVRLKDGEFKYQIRPTNGGSFNFGKVYYLDLTGDPIKEAFVLLSRTDCGAGCDGGAYLLYIYTSKNQKPVLLWQLEFGGTAYTCGLKSLTVKEKKIYFDVFDNCYEKNNKLEDQPDDNTRGKGMSFGVTEFTYGYNGKTFVREKTQFGQPQRFETGSYRAEISIND